jgi:hypothetical protein
LSRDPFSGDVVGIDAVTLKIKRVVKLGRQPLEVMALPHGEVMARDWKTGEVLHGKLERRWFVREHVATVESLRRPAPAARSR